MEKKSKVERGWMARTHAGVESRRDSKIRATIEVLFGVSKKKKRSLSMQKETDDKR